MRIRTRLNVSIDEILDEEKIEILFDSIYVHRLMSFNSNEPRTNSIDDKKRKSIVEEKKKKKELKFRFLRRCLVVDDWLLELAIELLFVHLNSLENRSVDVLMLVTFDTCPTLLKKTEDVFCLFFCSIRNRFLHSLNLI